jgi:translocation and assembly module TamB
LRLVTTDGRLFTEEPGETVTLLAFQPIKLNAELTPEGLDFVGSIPLESGSGIEFEAEIAGTEGPFSERSMEASVRGAIADLGFITALAPEVQRIDGQLQLDVQLGGTPGAPVLQGGSVLELGALTLATPAIELQDIRVELSGPGTGDIAIDAHARSGGGQLRLQGKANLVAETKAELALTGADFLVMDTPEAQVYLSPDLRLALEGNRIDLQGEVRVPKADIRLKKLPEGAVSESRDQVIVKPDDEATPLGDYLLNARVRLILGDKVSFEGFGLEARIAGNVLVVEAPRQLTTATGELALVGGQYRAYGQNLVIERGRLLFAGGDIGNPGLDVRAVRRPEADVLVGVNVRGTLRDPKPTLFSEPAMSTNEQLSYLLLGRPLANTNTDEQSQMSQAAMALGLMGGGALSKSIGRQIGLDDVGIEKGSGGSAEDASLVVGKYLSPKLYVGYGIGIFDPISTLRLRYTLSPRWTIQSESSAAQSGADLLFTIERGR